jgi:hypothetical protein
MERIALEDDTNPIIKLHYCLVPVGETAAVLGDITIAKRIMNQLAHQECYYHVSQIAAIIGDIKTAEDILWEAKKKDKYFHPSCINFCRYQTASRHNPEAAIHMMKVLENHGIDISNIRWAY